MESSLDGSNRLDKLEERIRKPEITKRKLSTKDYRETKRLYEKRLRKMKDRMKRSNINPIIVSQKHEREGERLGQR